MSDDEDYLDLDDLFLWEDEPIDDITAVADDLAEHAVQSPAPTYDPSLEMADYWSDWEYYSDDYYDADPVSQRRSSTKKSSEMNPSGVDRRAEEQRQDKPGPDKAPPDFGRGQYPSIVRWRSKETPDPVVDLDSTVSLEKVAILKHWRDLGKVHSMRKPLDGLAKGDDGTSGNGTPAEAAPRALQAAINPGTTRKRKASGREDGPNDGTGPGAETSTVSRKKIKDEPASSAASITATAAATITDRPVGSTRSRIN